MKNSLEGMKRWNFEDGIWVQIHNFDYDLKAFAVYEGERYLGTVTPADLTSMQYCIREMENGNDPIAGGWEDGNGHTCTLEGWG